MIFSKLSGAIYDALFGYESIFYQSLKGLFNTLTLGVFDSIFEGNEAILNAAEKKNTGIGLGSLQLNEIASDERYDEGQMEGLGKITAALKTELARQKSVGDTKSVADITAILEKISNKKDSYFGSLDSDEFVQGIARDVAKYQGITLNIDQADDAASDAKKSSLLGSGGMALVRNSSSGLDVTQYAKGDQVVAGKEGGPIVNAIAYAGNAINWLLEKEQNMISALTGASTPSTGMGSSSEIKIYLQVDGNTLTEVVLDNDLIRKATSKKNGRYTLSDGSVIDAAGSSVQSSSV